MIMLFWSKSKYPAGCDGSVRNCNEGRCDPEHGLLRLQLLQSEEGVPKDIKMLSVSVLESKISATDLCEARSGSGRRKSCKEH